MSAFKNKYGQDCDPGIDQEISALMKQSKMSSFELVGMQKIKKKQAYVLFILYYLFSIIHNLLFKDSYKLH